MNFAFFYRSKIKIIKFNRMVNLLNVFLIVNFLGFLVLFLRVYYNGKITNFGVMLIILQSFLLLLILYNRSLSFGFSILFFFYLSSLPVALDLFIKLKKLRAKKKKSIFEELSRKAADFLDTSFFNFLFCNNGIFTLSRKIFCKLDTFLIPYKTNPIRLLKIFVVFPWLILIVSLSLEFFFLEKIYFSAILLSITIIIKRLFLFTLRVLEYSALEHLNFAYAKYFFFAMSSSKYSLHIIFQNENFLRELLKQEEKNEEYYSKKVSFLNSAINFSSSYFCSKLLKFYFFPKLSMFLNALTFLIVFLFVILKYYLKFYLLLDFLVLDIFFLFYLFSFFDFAYSSNLNKIIENQKILLNIPVVYKKLLVSKDLLKPNVNLNIIYPEHVKVKNIFHFFQEPDSMFVSPKKTRKFSFNYLLLIIIFLEFFIFCYLQSFEVIWFFNLNFSFFNLAFLVEIKSFTLDFFSFFNFFNKEVFSIFFINFSFIATILDYFIKK